MAKTVLIVEDNELNMKLFHDLLEAHGIQTLETRSGLEVMDIARAKKPDLILMDIQLPEVSGLDVTKWLKADEELKHIPVIAVTAFAMKGDEEKIRQGGCEDYISKPISVVRFIEVVQTYLNKAATPEQGAKDPQEEPKDGSDAGEEAALSMPLETSDANTEIISEEIGGASVEENGTDKAAPDFEIKVREDDEDEMADDFLFGEEEEKFPLLDESESGAGETTDNSKTTGDR